MATYSVNDVDDKGGRPNIPNKTVVFLRCMGIEKTVSKKGNDMLVFKWEIAATVNNTDELNIGGKPTKIAGLQLTDWVVLGIDMGMKKLKAIIRATDAPTSLDVEDPEVLKQAFLGKGIRAEIKTEEVTKMQNSDQIDAETGKAVEVPMLDDDGNPIKDNNYRLVTVVGKGSDYTIPFDSVKSAF